VKIKLYYEYLFSLFNKLLDNQATHESAEASDENEDRAASDEDEAASDEVLEMMSADVNVTSTSLLLS